MGTIESISHMKVGIRMDVNPTSFPVAVYVVGDTTWRFVLVGRNGDVCYGICTSGFPSFARRKGAIGKRVATTPLSTTDEKHVSFASARQVLVSSMGGECIYDFEDSPPILNNQGFEGLWIPCVLIPKNTRGLGVRGDDKSIPMCFAKRGPVNIGGMQKNVLMLVLTLSCSNFFDIQTDPDDPGESFDVIERDTFSGFVACNQMIGPRADPFMMRMADELTQSKPSVQIPYEVVAWWNEQRKKHGGSGTKTCSAIFQNKDKKRLDMLEHGIACQMAATIEADGTVVPACKIDKVVGQSGNIVSCFPLDPARANQQVYPGTHPIWRLPDYDPPGPSDVTFEHIECKLEAGQRHIELTNQGNNPSIETLRTKVKTALSQMNVTKAQAQVYIGPRVFDVTGIDGNRMTIKLPIPYSVPFTVLMIKFSKTV